LARGMPQDPVGDYVLYCCCGPCTICQDAREIRDIVSSANLPPAAYGVPYSPQQYQYQYPEPAFVGGWAPYWVGPEQADVPPTVPLFGSG
jgi:hypothetical protein